MANEKSILEDAFLDAKRIQEALNANTKEILRSITKEEIDSVVKESLQEDYLEEDVEDTEELEMDAEAGAEVEMDSEEGDLEVGDIENSEEGDDIESDELEGDYESGMDAVASDDEVEMDMTAASDDDVIAVYKKLTGDDEIEVVVDDEAGEVHLSVEEPGEYVIKTNEPSEEADEELDIEMEEGSYEESYNMEEAKDVDEEIVYEIALDEKEITEEESCEEGEEISEEVVSEEEACEEGEELSEEVVSEEEACEEGEELSEEEVAEGDEKIDEKISVNAKEERGSGGNLTSTKGPGARQAAKFLGHEVNESEVNEKYNTLLTEAKELKGRNEEYKGALKKFRTMLAETVVFNSNLTYVAKLFMEHSTTKEEKESIFKRFDNEVSTLKESKKLYKTIDSELVNKKPINESIENKIVTEVASSKSAQLNESTAYVDKETSRIMDLMKRVNNR